MYDSVGVAMFESVNIELIPRTSRLPIIYVFGQKDIDVERSVTSVIEFFVVHMPKEGVRKPDTILLRHDVTYTHRAGKLTKH